MKKDLTFSNGTQAFSIKLSTVEPPVLDVVRIQRQAYNAVLWGGTKKNTFIKYLSDASTVKSLEHAALLDTKRKFVYSGGLTYGGEQGEAVETFFSTITNRKKSGNELLKGFARNYTKYEIAYFEVIYGKGLKKIVQINPLNTAQVAPNKDLDKYGYVIDYTFCVNFDNFNAEREIVPRFDLENPAPKQIAAIYVQGDLQPYYPDLSYGSALNYIELSHSIGKYLLSYSENGMFSSGFFNIQTDNMPEDVFQDIEQQLQAAFAGVDNAGRIFVFANKDKDAVSFSPLSTNDNTAWITALNDIVISKICSIHKANPMIAAISKDGAGFSNTADEINESIRNFYTDQVEPTQELFLDFMKEVADFNGFTDYTIDVITPAKLKPVIPQEIIAELTIKKKAELYGLDEEDFIDFEAQGTPNVNDELVPAQPVGQLPAKKNKLLN